MDTDNRFQIENLAFQGFGPCSLTLLPGACVGLSGASGSGKTRLLRALCDLDPHQGKVYLGDRECREFEAPQWRRRVAMLAAESAWWQDWVGAHFASMNEAWLSNLGFDRTVMDQPVSRLSTGERQRLALLRMLAMQPRVLLLDEPTASLDVENAHRVEALIAAYQEREKTPVLWVSHDRSQLERVADQRFILVNGCLVEAAKKEA